MAPVSSKRPTTTFPSNHGKAAAFLCYLRGPFSLRPDSRAPALPRPGIYLMRHLPDSRLQASLSELTGREIARCSTCLSVLDFDTDGRGYCVEICNKCHTRQPMGQVVSRFVSEKPAELIDPVKCLDCPAMIGRTDSTSGSRRRRCNDCTTARQQRMVRDRMRLVRNRRVA